MATLRRLASITGTVAVLIALAGCGGGEVESASRDVDIAVLERQVADLKVELRALDRELNQVRETLDRTDYAALNRELARIDQTMRSADLTLDRREVRRMIQEALAAN